MKIGMKTYKCKRHITSPTYTTLLSVLSTVGHPEETSGAGEKNMQKPALKKKPPRQILGECFSIL